MGANYSISIFHADFVGSAQEMTQGQTTPILIGFELITIRLVKVFPISFRHVSAKQTQKGKLE